MTLNNYQQVIKCYYCEGYKACDLYTRGTTSLCGWKETVQSDLKKIAEGEGIPTFPILEEIVKQDVMREMK